MPQTFEYFPTIHLHPLDWVSLLSGRRRRTITMSRGRNLCLHAREREREKFTFILILGRLSIFKFFFFFLCFLVPKNSGEYLPGCSSFFLFFSLFIFDTDHFPSMKSDDASATFLESSLLRLNFLGPSISSIFEFPDS